LLQLNARLTHVLLDEERSLSKPTGALGS